MSLSINHIENMVKLTQFISYNCGKKQRFSGLIKRRLSTKCKMAFGKTIETGWF